MRRKQLSVLQMGVRNGTIMERNLYGEVCRTRAMQMTAVMLKKWIGVLLCLILIFSVCQKTAFAAGVTEITITPDQSEVYIGDTITYTISIGAVERMQGFEFKIVVPEGLTYNEGSYHVTDGLRKTFGSEKADFTFCMYFQRQH